MDVFSYNKSLQNRVEEYTKILSGKDYLVPASQIRSEWSYHLEFVIEPVGWKALWKIPRLTCQEFDIHYPNIVAVMVENIELSELSSLVKIVAVQEDIHLPEKYHVPLIELYPTKEQDNSAIDIETTAECIDQLRFFYNHLWMPWDAGDDDTQDWVNNHLETRLRLYFNMKRGDVCKRTCDIIRTLIREGFDIQSKILNIESELSDEDGGTSDEQSNSTIDETKACQLMKLHFRLQQIKNEMEVLENPAMRDILVRNQSLLSNEKEFKRRESRGKQIEAHFVWLGGSLKDTLSALNHAKTFLQSDIFTKTSSSLQDAVDTADRGDIIIIGPGVHQIKGSGNLEEGGTLRGLYLPENTNLIPQETESCPTLFDFSGDEVVLENLSIDLKDIQVGIIVRKGTVQLKNCRFMLLGESITKIGVIVLPGAKLIAINSQFVGLGTSINIYNSGEAIISESIFENCAEGIQVTQNSKLSACSCTFTNIKEHGIRFETENLSHSSESKVGNVDLLENESNIVVKNCKFENNLKGNVMIRSLGTSLLPPSQDVIMSE